MFRRDIPIARFVVLILLTVAAVLSAALGTVDHLNERARLMDELRTSTRVQADQLAASLALPVWNFDRSQQRQIAESVLHDREAAGIVIYINDVSSPGGFQINGLVRNADSTREISSDITPAAGQLLEQRPLLANGQTIGAVKVIYTSQYMEASLRQHLLNQVLTFIVFGTVLAAGLYLLLWRTVLRPLLAIEDFARRVSSDTSPPLSRNAAKAAVPFRGELDRLRLSIEKMVQLLAERYAALQQNQTMLSAVLNATPQFIFWKDRDSRYLGCNEAFARLARLPGAQIVGKRDTDLPWSADEPAYRAADQQVMASGQALSHFLESVRIGNQEMTVETSKVPLADASGAVYGVLGVFEDVTARLEAQRRIAEQLRFEALVAKISARLASATPDTLQGILAPAMQDLAAFFSADHVQLARLDEHSGAPSIAAAAGDVDLALSHEPWSQHYPVLWQLLLGGQAWSTENVAELPEKFAVERTTLRQAGVQSQATVPVILGGSLRYILSVAATQARRLWSEEAIARMKVLAELFATALLRSDSEIALRLTQYAVDHSPVIIFRVDMDGRFVYANEAACAQFGYTPAEMNRCHVWDVSHVTTLANHQLRFEHFRQQGSVLFESWYRKRDGSSFPAEVRIQYVEFAGQRHFFVFGIDITQRQAAQEAEHAHTRRITKLATELTHAEERQRRELATVLHDGVGQNLFATTTQLLAARAHAGVAVPEIEKALALLDQATRDTRELTFQLCPPVLYQLGLAPALRRLADQFTQRYGVACTLEGQTPGPQDLDLRGLAYQTIRELLNNVAKHARARHVQIHADDVSGHVQLEVRDDGRGFDPATVAPGAGGFGLFHLQERIALLGGRLTIDATPGQGCRVQFRLPLKTPELTE